MGSGKDRTKKLLALIKLIILIGIIAGIPLYCYLRYGSEFFSVDMVHRLETYLMMHKKGAALTLVIIQVLQVIICFIPGQPIQLAASYTFGILAGFLISILGAVIGVSVSFYLARVLGRDTVELLFGESKVDEYDAKLNSGKGLLIVLLIYLLPGVPKDLVAYVAGISGMRFRPFLLISTIGRSPGMLGSLLMGHFLGTRNYRAIAVLAVITAVILIICFIKRSDILRLLDEIEAKDAARQQKGD